MDRNLAFAPQAGTIVTSLSARRAWIEIIWPVAYDATNHVALRKESVDRNIAAILDEGQNSRRSPQGERG